MLDNVDLMLESVKQSKSEREKLLKALNDIEGVQAFDSQANFVLMHTQKPADLVNEKLFDRGIMVKKWGKILQYENCFRVTVGLPEMNANPVEALKVISEADE